MGNGKPAEPAGDASDEGVLMNAHGVRLTARRLEARGRAYALADVHRARALRERPKLILPVMLGLAAAIALPPILSVLHLFGGGVAEYVELGLVLAGMAVFASFARLMLAGDTWWLVLELAEGEARAYASSDREFVSALVDIVTHALPAAR